MPDPRRSTGQRPTIIDDLTVIVPTVGRPVLRRCLQSLVDCTMWPVRLVVVDQSSNPDVARWLADARGAGMETLHVKSLSEGESAARNCGIERVETPFLAMNDDDQVVDPDWIERMSHWVRHSADAVITGMVAPESERVPSVIAARESVVHTRPLLTRDPLFVGNMGTSLDVIHRVGLFDERRSLFHGAEDNDWGYRALRAGIPIIYAPDVRVTHLDWRDERELEDTYRRYARGQGAFYGKHLRHGDLFIARRAARDLLRAPWLLVRAFFTRNQGLARMGRAELMGILGGIQAGFRSERDADGSRPHRFPGCNHR
jgi:GT2 family glycosyltransferase